MAVSYPIPTESYGATYTAREQAALRRAMRLLERGLRAQHAVLDTPTAVKDYLRLWIGHQPVEVFAALFLDTRHRLIASEELFRGTLTQTSVYPREVVKAALAHNAASVILAHNHPSGGAEPSIEDCFLTDTLRAALEPVDVRVLDHLIATRGGVFSFSEHGLLRAG